MCRCVMGMLTGYLKSSGSKKEDADKLWTKVFECDYLLQTRCDSAKASERKSTDWEGGERDRANW